MAVTAADLGKRVGITGPDTPTLVDLGRTLNAVRAKIGATHGLPPEPTDEQLDAWDEAELLAGARLWKRHFTPEGVLAMGDSGVIRVGRFDADVDDLLAEFTVYAIG